MRRCGLSPGDRADGAGTPPRAVELPRVRRHERLPRPRPALVDGHDERTVTCWLAGVTPLRNYVLGNKPHKTLLALVLHPSSGNIVKEICRVCRETAVLETEGLCPDCARIKAQIRLRFPDAVCRTMATSAECPRFGCLCPACSRGTIDRHPLYLSDPTRADRREIHLRPRCHELWLEAMKGQPAARTGV
jgi:hypothetical protein